MKYLPGFELNPTFWLFIAFASVGFIQLIFILFIYSRLAFFRAKKQPKSTNMPPVSILIAARNESDNLFQNLPKILEQDYPNFEVIVVNHQSIDESYHVLNAYRMQYPYLKIVEIERSRHLSNGKKFPLTLGIKSAKHEHLLFTDADCVPASKDWLKEMVSLFSPKKEIIMGYGPYQKEPGFLNALIRLDTTFVAMNYFAFALAKVPYMAVGRNLAYTKKVFYGVKGFKSHYSISSGDDDLFIQEAAKKKNYTVNLNPDTFCYSKAKSTWKEWRNQKARHYTTSEKYTVIKKALLGIYPLSLLLMWISFVILMLDWEYRWLTLAIFSFILILKWFVQGRCLFRIKEKSFVFGFLFLDLFYALLMPILYYTSEKSNTTKWK